MEKIRKQLLEEVIECELTMFVAVNNQGGTSSCQERPETFRLMRWMLFSVMPNEYLQSYLDDLVAAEESGRNFMVEKYARMDNLIPPVSEDMEKVASIADVEEKWMNEVSARYPSTFPDNGGHFRRYFSAELETLSVKTLSLYEKRLHEALEKGENLARLRYENMAQKMGMASLEEREKLRCQQ